MGANSKIEWCHHTANLWHGCVEVHEGCDNCYARVLNNRYHKTNPNWGNKAPRLEVKSVWDNLDKFQKLAKEANEIHRVFVGSMMDIFEKPMPVVDNKGQLTGFETDYYRLLLFEAIEDGRYPNLLFLFLTKRPSNINKYILREWKKRPPSNVMFGTSPVNQATADKLIPQLLQVKGKKFLSCEPMLGEIDLHHSYMYSPTTKVGYRNFGERCSSCTGKGYYSETGINDDPHIDWVICGGESGAHKRPFNADCARGLRNQCKDAGVAFFMKQIDKVQPIPNDLMIRQFPTI